MILNKNMENKKHPISQVIWVKLEKVFSNEYNPNKVAPPEMRLLEKSILEDGYTQPIVCYHDKNNDRYVIVDGFHRYRVCKENNKIRESTNGCLPVVVINKKISERMASTIRHNRARGTHQVSNMADIVSQLFLSGWTNKRIGEELGMDLDEINRLKQFTGLGLLFKNTEFTKAESDEIDFKWRYRKEYFK
jgi:ParB-like chromosome segregation protein Spo0J